MLWLLIGFLFLPFTAWQTVIPLAAWLAPVFLLRFARTSGRTRSALRLIFLANAAGIFIATRDLVNFSRIDILIFNILQVPLFRGLMYTLPYAADRLIGPRLGKHPWARLLVFPLAFTSVDWVLSLIPFANSAGSPAYSQIESLALMQILSITGMWGMTFLIMWFASTVNALWEHQFDWRSVRGPAALFTGVLLAAILYGSVRLNFAAPSSPTVEAATITIDPELIQAVSGSVDWTTFNQSTDAQRAAARPQFAATVDQMLARSETALRGGAKIVGWQEFSALALDEDRQSVLDRASALAQQYAATLDITLWVAPRSNTLPYTHNQSIMIDPTGKVVWTYDKTYPVIPGEAYVMVPGSGQLPIANSKYSRLGTAICNDNHFPPLIRQAGQKGVDILLTPYSAIPPLASMDYAIAVSRSIENGYSLVRATGNGVSTITDYEGRLLGSQDEYNSSNGIMLASVPTHGVTTIYSRVGDLFAYLCAAGLVFLIGWAFVYRKNAFAVVEHQPAG